MRTIETLEFTILSDSRTIRKIQAFSKKRNVSSYDSAGSISDEELKQVMAMAESLSNAVLSWLSETHSELMEPVDPLG